MFLGMNTSQKTISAMTVSRRMATSYVHMDLIADIIVRLPIKSLLRFRCVCKSWCRLISSPNFISMHLNQSTTEGYLLMKQPLKKEADGGYSVYYVDETFNKHMKLEFPLQINKRAQFCCSCNGLICFSNSENSYLWNPTVNKFKVIPNSSFSSSKLLVFGFGFVPRINDYKLVRMWYNQEELVRYESYDNGAGVPMLQVETYTLTSNLWRKIKHEVSCLLADGVTGVVVNGAVHSVEISYENNCKNLYILAFAMDTETFREIQPPKSCDRCSHGLLNGCLGVYKESLSFFSGCCNSEPPEFFNFDIWVMKEYGVGNSWFKWFTIDGNLGISHPLRFTNDDKVLAVGIDGEELVLYNQKNRQAMNLPIPVLHAYMHPCHVTTYVRSLVLLDESKDAKSDVSDVIRKQIRIRSKKSKAKGPSRCCSAVWSFLSTKLS